MDNGQAVMKDFQKFLWASFCCSWLETTYFGDLVYFCPPAPYISYIIHIIYTIYMYSNTPIYRGFWGKETYSAVNQGSR